MNKLVTIAVLLGIIGLPAFAQKGGHSHSSTKGSTVHVKEYQKKDGTAVPAHDRTAPDKTQTNNWSAKPNVNPETGKAGTKEPVK